MANNIFKPRYASLTNLAVPAIPPKWGESIIGNTPVRFNNFENSIHTKKMGPRINGVVVSDSGIYIVKYVLTIVQDQTQNESAGTMLPRFSIAVNENLVEDGTSVLGLAYNSTDQLNFNNIDFTGNIYSLAVNQIYGHCLITISEKSFVSIINTSQVVDTTNLTLTSTIDLVGLYSESSLSKDVLPLISRGGQTFVNANLIIEKIANLCASPCIELCDNIKIHKEQYAYNFNVSKIPTNLLSGGEPVGQFAPVPFNAYESALHSKDIIPINTGVIVKKPGIYDVSYILTIIQDRVDNNTIKGTIAPIFAIAVNGIIYSNDNSSRNNIYPIFNVDSNVALVSSIGQIYGQSIVEIDECNSTISIINVSQQSTYSSGVIDLLGTLMPTNTISDDNDIRVNVSLGFLVQGGVPFTNASMIVKKIGEINKKKCCENKIYQKIYKKNIEYAVLSNSSKESTLFGSPIALNDSIPFNNFKTNIHTNNIIPTATGALIKEKGIYKISYYLTLVQDKLITLSEKNGITLPKFSIAVNNSIKSSSQIGMISPTLFVIIYDDNTTIITFLSSTHYTFNIRQIYGQCILKICESDSIVSILNTSQVQFYLTGLVDLLENVSVINSEDLIGGLNRYILEKGGNKSNNAVMIIEKLD